MAEKYAEVKLTKCTLYILECDIWRYLPGDVIEAAIKRGKLFKRCKRVEQFALKQQEGTRQ